MSNFEAVGLIIAVGLPLVLWLLFEWFTRPGSPRRISVYSKEYREMMRRPEPLPKLGGDNATKGIES